MKVYDQEAKDNLADLLEAGGRVAYASRAVASKLPLERSPLALRAAASAKLAQPDLYGLRAVLAHTGDNLNDDFFERWETWRARATADDKQFNFEHDQLDIIGHITESEVFDAAGEPYAGDEPPEAFGIAVNSVLYTVWPEHPDRQKRMQKVVAALETPKEGDEWYVSMECLFKSFDYLLTPQGDAGGMAKARIVDRTNSTAFLTKYLRAYGGTGVYDGNRVLRVFRDFVFSGKGLVREPADPKAVIFGPGDAPSKGTAAKIFHFSAPSGYLKSSGGAEPTTVKTEAVMTEAEANALREQVKTLTANLEAAKAAELKAKEDNLQKALDEAKAELTAAKAELAVTEKLKADLDAALKAVDEFKVKYEAAEANVAKAAADAKLADRALELKDAYGLESLEDAKAQAALLAPLADDKFAEHVTAMKAKLPGKVSDKAAPNAGQDPLVKADKTEGASPPPAANVVEAATAAVKDAVTTEVAGVVATPAAKGFDFDKAVADTKVAFEKAAAATVKKPAKAAK